MLNTRYKIQNTRYKSKGFTLVELLIYTGISVVIGGLTVGTLITVTRINQNASATAEVSGQMNFVLQRLQQLVSESSNIDIDAGVTTSTVKLRMQDSAKDPTCISLVNGVIKLAEGPGSNPNDCNSTTSDLTSSKVVVNALNFKKMTSYPGHDTLSLDMTMAFNTSNPGSQISRTLSSAIARVSAATFDSNLLPGSDNQYEVGYTGQRWKNISISNLLNVGQLANDPTSGMANGSIYYNTSSSIFRGYQNSAWTNIGSSQWVTSSTAIYYNTGNVGIGTTNPTSNLTIAATSNARLGIEGTAMTAFSANQKTAFGSASNYSPTELSLANNTTGGAWLKSFNTGAAGGIGGYFTSYSENDLTTYSSFEFVAKKHDGAGALTSHGNSARIFSVLNNTTNLFNVLGNGNVGIGTTGPLSKAQINLAGVTGASKALLSTFGSGGRIVLHNTAGGSTDSEVGIFGTAAGDGNGLASGIGFARESDANWGMQLRFYVRPTATVSTDTIAEAMRITSTGNVGIGTTAPGYKLDVKGNIVNSNPSQGYLGLTGDLPGYADNTYPTLKTNFSYIYFSVAGVYSAYMNSAGALTGVSDRAKKENFVEVDPQLILGKIDQLPMYQWNFKAEDPSIKHIAPVAQDFYALFGLNGNDDKMISNIDPSGVALVGIKALLEKAKVQEGQIVKLQQEIEELKLQLNSRK